MKMFYLLLSLFAVHQTASLALEPAHTSKEHKKPSLTIDPTLRALDYQQAYETLKKEKPSNKVCIKLLDGSILSNIIEMQKMASSTLFLIRYNTPQGIKIQAVELETIVGIGYLE